MSIESERRITLAFSGDITWTQEIAAANNTSANGQSDIVNLSNGFNTITIPTGGGTIPTAVTIIPPDGNTNTITLKGVTGDTGISLHKLDPTTIGLNSSVTTIGLTAGAAITGVRIIYS